MSLCWLILKKKKGKRNGLSFHRIWNRVNGNGKIGEYNKICQPKDRFQRMIAAFVISNGIFLFLFVKSTKILNKEQQIQIWYPLNKNHTKQVCQRVLQNLSPNYTDYLKSLSTPSKRNEKKRRAPPTLGITESFTGRHAGFTDVTLK